MPVSCIGASYYGGIAASFAHTMRLAQTGRWSSRYGGKTTAALKSSNVPR
jgi:hypothetical protein